MASAAVIFDLDGTILDTLPDLASSLNAVLRGRGLPARDLGAVRLMIGSGIKNLIRRALDPGWAPGQASAPPSPPPSPAGSGGPPPGPPAGSGGPAPEPALPDGILDEFKREYAKRQLDQTAPYPGIERLLADLAARGARLAVLSNKDHDNSRIIIERFFPGRFQVVQGAEPSLPLKPDPAGAIRTLAALGADPARTLYLGDSAVDMLTAKAARLTPLGAAWGFRPEAELVAAGAAAVLKTPSELLIHYDREEGRP
jgi:phosphoglycolate phosphatase